MIIEKKLKGFDNKLLYDNIITRNVLVGYALVFTGICLILVAEIVEKHILWYK